MFDSKAKRAAALGFGLGFLSILPVAAGAITIEAAGQALGAYYFNLGAPLEPEPTVITVATEDRTIVVPWEDRTFVVAASPGQITV